MGDMIGRAVNMENKRYERVAELLEREKLGLEWLVRSTGLERRIAESIARQRYASSPERRMRVARALGIQAHNCDEDHAARR